VEKIREEALCIIQDFCCQSGAGCIQVGVGAGVGAGALPSSRTCGHCGGSCCSSTYCSGGDSMLGSDKHHCGSRNMVEVFTS
jgi:hypothetical protein